MRRNDWQEADRVAQATKGGEAHLAVRLLDAPEEIRAQEAFIMSESKQVLDRYKEGLSYLSSSLPWRLFWDSLGPLRE